MTLKPQNTGRTLPRLLSERATAHGGQTALREKRYGLWRAYSWAEYEKGVRQIALGLAEMGFCPGRTAIFMGENRPRMLMAQLAAISVGGRAVWLFADASEEETVHFVNHSEASFFVAETQEEVDRALAVKPLCPALSTIIWDDPEGMRGYRHNFVTSIDCVAEKGRLLDTQRPGLFGSMLDGLNPSDPCLLFYTSGTTARPKGALISHENMISMAENLLAVDPVKDTDDFVSFLPFAWIGEQMFSVAAALLAGFTVNFCESRETLREDLREIAPHVIFGPPRFYEALARDILVQRQDTSPLKRLALDWAIRQGEKSGGLLRQKQVSPAGKAKNALAEVLVNGRVRDYLGFNRLRRAYTGGAPLSERHFGLFHGLGINLKQAYGQTEASGLLSIHRDYDVKPGTVGRPLPNTLLDFSPDGEVLVSGPAVFSGYEKDSKATEKALAGGVLHTGDRGYTDQDGHLVVTDRADDLISLSDGREFCPQAAESLIRFSPFIREAWVVGQNRPFAAALLCMAFEPVSRWAGRFKIPHSDYADLAGQPKVLDLCAEIIKEANGLLPEPAQIRRFVVLPKVLDPDDGEITRTGKLRRALLEKRYARAVEALYQKEGGFSLEITVNYEDGQTRTMQKTVTVCKVP